MKRISLISLLLLFSCCCILSCEKPAEEETIEGEFLKIKVNGEPTNFVAPDDFVKFYNDGPPLVILTARKMMGDSTIQANIGFEPGNPTVTGGTYTITAMNSTLFGFVGNTGINVNANASKITFTEYGEIGEHVGGSFVIVANDPTPPHATFNMSGSFRMIRFW